MSEFSTPSASAVILAAGNGSRAGSADGKPKQFREIAGIPLLAHSLQTFERCGQTGEIVIVAPEKHLELTGEIADRFGISKGKVVAGGETRFESARAGFAKTSKDAKAVVFHDAARPFVQISHILEVISGALETGAATAGIPLDDSIKKTRPLCGKQGGICVEKTVSRSQVWRIQTPQAFRRELLAEIYEKFSGDPSEIGDETALFERAGGKAAVVAGSRRNMKITTEEDFVIAEAIAKISKPEIEDKVL